jgi:acyl dehydratase
MPVRVVRGLDELRTLVGQRIGTSDWIVVSQERVNAFAQATDDFQWIHCDAERAARESPYGRPVAHGFLTLSLVTSLSQQVLTIEGVSMMVNYGLNRVRFPRPVPVGARLRMSVELMDMKESTHSAQATFKQTFEVEGESGPVCVAETLVRLFP